MQNQAHILGDSTPESEEMQMKNLTMLEYIMLQFIVQTGRVFLNNRNFTNV